MLLKLKSSLFLILLTSILIVGQTPQAQKPSQRDDEEVVRITTNLVQVDAVVTDKKGNVVTDLRPDEFKIFEDGKPQSITNFSYVRLTEQLATPPLESKVTTERSTPAVPPVPLRPDQVRRTIALIVDDLGLSFESTDVVRHSLRKYVDQQVQPGDLVAILRTAAGIGALQQFTTDKRQLYAAIDRIRWYPHGRSGIGAFEPINSSMINSNTSSTGSSSLDDFLADQDDPEAFRQGVLAVGTLGALRYVIKGLDKLPGRKAVVLFSDGLTIKSVKGSANQTLEAMKFIVEEANRSSVVVYTMDARGLVYTGPTAADYLSDMRVAHIDDPKNGPQINDPLNGPLAARRDALYDGQEGLDFLARQTGGIPIRDTNDLSGGLRKVMDDQRGYYLIGYKPDPGSFYLESGRRKFHSLSIRVTRPGLNVRSRRGFYGAPDQPAQPLAGTRNEQMIGALTSPFGESGVNVRLTSLFSNDGKAGSFVRSLLHVKASDLSFSDEPDGWKKVVFDVLAVTYGDNGSVVDQIGKTETVRMSQRLFKHVSESGFDYVFTFPIKKPGAYQFRAAFRDSTTERVGSATQFLEVPDIKKGRLTLSGIVIEGYGESTPSPANAPEGSVPSLVDGWNVPRDPGAGPGVRKFERGMIMNYGFQIYNAQSDKTSGPNLQWQVRVFKDGKPIYSGKQLSVSVAGAPDLKRLPAGGSLQIRDHMELGDYVMQVVVTDAAAPEKHRTATQWIDFEIVSSSGQ
jgi:VWFA-related protein